MLSHVSKKIGIYILEDCVALLLLRLHQTCPSVLIHVWRFVVNCHLLLLEHQVRAVARFCLDQSSTALNYRRYVIGLCMLPKVRGNPPPCRRARHTGTGVGSNPSECEVPRSGTSQFAKYFIPAHANPWNNLECAVFDSETLNGLKVACLSMFSSFQYCENFREHIFFPLYELLI